MAGLLSISLTGLNAAQAALNTTSHNISNANVTGYSRQQVVQTTADPMFTGSGFFGQGTELATVKRIYSQFLNSQVLAADTSRAQNQAYYDQIKQVDNLLSNASAGLSTVLSTFFEGVQQVAADPSSIPSRQSMLSSSEALATRFQAMQSRLQEIRDGVETQIGQSVDDINTLAKQISSLNKKIVTAQATGTMVPANDLLDQRDTLVTQLNQQIKVTTGENSDGSLNVFIGSGQPLVMGADVFKMSTTPSSTDPSRSAVGVQLVGGGVVPIPESLLSGGALGGLLSYRSDSLDTAQNAIGRIAIGLTTEFNAQHALGQDLSGNMGVNYFTPLSPAVQNLTNTTTGVASTASVTASVSDAAGLTTDDYVLAYDGTNYSLSRASDGSVVPGSGSVPMNVEGLSITGTMSAGDRVLIQPTRYAARDISVAIKDTRLIAAASPVSVKAANTNSGTGAVTQPSVTSLTGILPGAGSHLAATISLTFAAGPPSQFNVLGAAPATIAYDPASNAAGSSVTLTNPNLTFSISGRPATGDVFTIDTNTSGSSDNRNANALYSLQSAKDLLGGTASFGYAYSQIVSDVGTKTSEAKTNTAAQQGLLDLATATQQGLSGVNLDEEAANLLRYQQAYQASARCINVAQTLFDEILKVMG